MSAPGTPHVADLLKLVSEYSSDDLDWLTQSIEETITARGEHPRPTVKCIVAAVSEASGISAEEIRSNRRNAEIMRARKIVYALCRELTLTSFPVIGRMIGREHSTIVITSKKLKPLINFVAARIPRESPVGVWAAMMVRHYDNVIGAGR